VGLFLYYIYPHKYFIYDVGCFAFYSGRTEMVNFDYSILVCPVTKESLKLLTKEEVLQRVQNYNQKLLQADQITEGFANISDTYFYPVIYDIILLLPVYALYTGNDGDSRGKMAFDKKRVFNYYNQISYQVRDGLHVYEDSAKWVDYRDIANEYIRHSFTRAKQHLNQQGKYLLDIASGPIGLQEYADLSENFEVRICADISVNALIQAKQNFGHRRGIYLCADISHIPLKDGVCDSVLCQHTLYHIPKKEQKTAVREMFRVAGKGASVVIVYSLFYHSWFMNLALFPFQIYRVLRHFAGKVYVRMSGNKPRLYFYPHSIGWFKRNFEFSNSIKFYCWRSTNKYFLKAFVHPWLGGKKLLQWLMRNEDRNSTFWGKFGEYPMIVIKK